MTSPSLRIRTATDADIAAMHHIRLGVSENRLAETSQVDEESYRSFIAAGGAWVAEMEAEVVGFAIVDAASKNVWAVFVSVSAEGLGIGRALHDRLVQWSRQQGLRKLWLSTSPGTRAEHFYRKLGWSEAGFTESGEIRFERRI